MNQVLGILFSNMHDFVINELTAKRCMGSIPVGGRYRLIDFVLSGLANSGVETVGVITKNNYQSLMDHLGSGREWDMARKRGGLVILPPFGQAESDGMYRSRIDAYAGIAEFIRRSSAETVLSTDCEWIANFDFRDFLRRHKETGADITLMYKKMPLDGTNIRDTNVLINDGEGFLQEMWLNPSVKGEYNVYMNVLLLSRELLLRTVADCVSRSKLSFDKDVLQEGIGRLKIATYEFEGYASRFDSVKTYFDVNMAMLDQKVRHSLFPQERPIYTKVRDEAPVRYGLDSRVGDSLIADGCLVEGEVHGSILFRGVRVEKGAVVRNSIVMQGSTVGSGSTLDYVITDKDVTIGEGRGVAGYETYPVYIGKGAMV